MTKSYTWSARHCKSEGEHAKGVDLHRRAANIPRHLPKDDKDMTSRSTLHAKDLLAHAEPRDPSSWRIDPDALADSALAMRADAPDEAALSLIEELGAPSLDVLVTPMSTRAALLGARAGRRFYHHELRRRVPMPEHMEPEVDVWGGETIPAWRDGVLEEPKYFSFFMDAPLPSFNPNHRRKWRAHEMLHGAVGFYWRPDLTRFEFYVSARLGELAPVAHWYGLDEIFRPRCPRHVNQGAQRAHCPDCEAAAAPYWLSGPPPQPALDAARSLSASSLEHFHSEWAACMSEISTGAAKPTPRGRLDASSDAIGYLMGHWPRVTSSSFGEWVERFLRVGVDYHDHLGDYAGHMASTFSSLVSGDLTVDVDQARALRLRRALHDLGYRALLLTEWVDDARYDRARDILDPHLDALTALSDALLEPGDAASLGAHSASARELSASLLGALALAPFDPALGADARALGHDLLTDDGELAPSALGSLSEGIAQITPDGVSLDDALTPRLAASADFHGLGPLSARLSAFLDGEAHPDAEALALDLWLTRPGKDAEAEAFGALPEELDELLDARSTLRLNTTARRETFSRELLADALPELAAAIQGDSIELLGVTLNGSLRVAPVDEALSALLDALARGERSVALEDADLTERLLFDGVLIWLPIPRA